MAVRISQGAWDLWRLTVQRALDQQQLAAELGVSPSAVSRWLPQVRHQRVTRAPSRTPTWTTALRIEQLYHIPATAWFDAFLDLDTDQILDFTATQPAPVESQP